MSMGNLKLPKLRDRTPIRLVITVMPDLHQALSDYAELYEKTYGRRESISDLIPSILEHFIASDRGFVRDRKTLANPHA